jgi:nucleoside diphosphate kinase
MSKKLTYVAITPYTLLKSRTGGIIGRILALSKDVRFAGARMFAPTDAMVDAYLETLDSENMSDVALAALKQYVDVNLRPNNAFGISNRMMVFLFEGDDAVKSLNEDVVGEVSTNMCGNTIRGTYGDFVLKDGKPWFFEPAVLMPSTSEANAKQLKVLQDFAMTDGGMLENVVKFEDKSKVQTTLVIIKPDNFLKRSSRPGNIIDVFSREGLYMVGTKLLRLSQENANEFYGPLRTIFIDKLKKLVVNGLKRGGDVFDFEITDEMYSQMADVLKDTNAECEFRKITNYMTGQDKEGAKLSERDRGKCLAILYQGENAVERIRARLGATNPAEAEDGTIRSIFASDLMRNGAHASDSAENAERERKIVGLWDEGGTCDFMERIASVLGTA